ncbi:MAG: CRISPR-associated helicase Cas3' [Legionellales bacterium]|nr:CRISPR-associated helicase Cas3' [Legionellales bacterium]
MLGRKIQNSTNSKNTLTLSLEDCLAKSQKTPENTLLAGRTVLSHCHVVGEVARAMTARMPDWLRAAFFPAGSELIAATHDIGKISPTFQKKIYQALSQKINAILLLLKNVNAEIEKSWGGHAGVSQATAQAQNTGQYIPEILGQHHGYSPIVLQQSTSNVFGGSAWEAQRVILIEKLKQALNTDFPKVDNALQARVLAGLTTVSDWIGSGPLFEDPTENWMPKIETALDVAGFSPPHFKYNLSFFDIFGFAPKPAQVKLIEAVTQPGVYVLEAPMGLGKTEAALYVAYQMLEKKLATGVYFALPTQLTSEKIHERVGKFLTKILHEDSEHQYATLVHSNAKLKYAEMGEEGNPGGAWFAQNKRGILAPFAVGTIDQALMAVMNVKHGFVRTFGLAGKVVILDEVHSYDSFTGTILDELIKALQQLHCTVIILSATLTHDRRAKLLNIQPQATAYPLITAQPNGGNLDELSVEHMPDVSVKIHCTDEVSSLEEALRRAEEGQQVLWIENTVKDAQAIYKKLAARTSEMNIDCGLLHSRFIKIDRAENEDKWVTYFGKNQTDKRTEKGRILVGTQVLEQSLDIDADFLVSRMAPTDMLLQRLGRLWRHEETARPVSAKCEAWILCPNLAEAILSPQSTFGDTAKVYSPYVLCRSLSVWENITQIHLPSQMRELIEATYAEQAETEVMAKHLHELETKRDKLINLALLGLSHNGKTLPEENAQTRYSELESTEVLLLRSCQPETHGAWITLLNNERLWVPLNARSLSRKEWNSLTVLLMKNTLKVSIHLAPNPLSRQQIAWLGDYFYLGKPEYDEEVMLRVALVGEDGKLSAFDHGVLHDKKNIYYDAMIGYQVLEP